MTSRLQNLIVRPWKAGLKTSDTPAFLQHDELSISNNVVFDASNGIRKSRGAFRFFDYTGIGVTRASSGTTRTVRVTPTSGQTFAVNDYVSVVHSDEINTNYDHKKVLVTSVDSATFPGDYVLTYTLTASLTEASTADTSIVVGKYIDERILGFYDFYYFSGGSKNQKRVAVASTGKVYQYASDGAKTEITVDSAVTWSTPVTSVSFATLGNILIMAFNGSNVALKWTGSGNISKLTNVDYAGVSVVATNPMPALQYIRMHQNRLFGTDKDDPDRLHYSAIDNAEQWNGEADSGAIDLPAEDADTAGLTGISYTYKGELFVSRNNQLYRLVGEAPLFQWVKVSNFIGCVAHDAFSQIDTEDSTFVSRKGVHSLSSSTVSGTLEGDYLSNNIQTDFNSLESSALAQIKSIFIASLNTVFFSFRETGEAENNTIYGLNIDKRDQVNPLKWTKFLSSSEDELKTTCLGKFINNGLDELILGSHEGRLFIYDTDFSKDLANSDIKFRIKTGIVYTDNNPSSVKGFKYIGLLYKTARDNITIDTEFQIDNFTKQTGQIVQTASGDLLGTTFILGTSVLGGVNIVLPEYLSIDGYGYGCTLNIQTVTPIEIYGYIVAFDNAGDQQDVIRSG